MVPDCYYCWDKNENTIAEVWLLFALILELYWVTEILTHFIELFAWIWHKWQNNFYKMSHYVFYYVFNYYYTEA